MTSSTGDTLLVYVGSYTKRTDSASAEQNYAYQGRGEGISLYRLNILTGMMEFVTVVATTINPSFLAFHPHRNMLYAVNQAAVINDKPGGTVSAFAIEPETGGLSLLNHQPSHGGGPCHLSVDQSGQYVLVSNYRTGTGCNLPIMEDGSLGIATDGYEHHGSSINPQRQDGPHAHSINIDPANRFAVVADLGLDKIMIYRLDLDGGKLTVNDPPWAQVEAGAGPRHFAFHPGGQYGFVINELNSTVTAFAYDGEQGALTEIQTISTLPGDFSGHSHTAEVQVSPAGNFLYGSNRGHDSIAIFAIDETTGRLTAVGHQSTQGQSPRNFGIDPSGTFLLAANQNSDTVIPFWIDQEQGTLIPTGQVIDVPSPVCVKMIRPETLKQRSV